MFQCVDFIFEGFPALPSLKLTAKAPENKPILPQKEDYIYSIPTIHFQEQTCAFQGGYIVWDGFVPHP